ncbi:PAS domain S-box-containing protein/diguanylate cyclase (GGDEF) domain-containing protein [Virgibacillus subterraneus]|uniref:PAS domain S-box-containing protein/diguanylate cyclase (GGDEF) domain-containing protein n=1 Tax=Virgibacillus subterraneus TaxID=621109 RepID=A0A1H9K017_9BACI|nr:diguanylate cyclase [Virgibacillus subterraneus]SEQ92420.1 PAS domain S-box-containing protein/diguanylate cyclase (GGDEF) domain-containing protein [Virgibacillus subterraneus]
MSYDKSLFFNNVLMNGIKEMVFIIAIDNNRDFCYEFLNHAAIKQTILTDKVIGRTIQDVYPQKTANFLIEKYTTAIELKDGLSYEDFYEAPSGIKYSETTLTPLCDNDGICTHIVALVKDITRRRMTEFEIQKSKNDLYRNKQKYRSLYDYNLDAIFSLSLTGNIQNGNSAVESVFGYNAKEMKNSPFTELFASKDKDLASKNFRNVIKGIPQEHQLTILNKSNEMVEVIVKLTPIIINDDIVGIYGIFKDINEQIQLGRKYKESEDQFRIITENSNDLITMIDNQGEIVYVSPSYKEVLDYEENEYINKPFLHNVHTDDRGRLQESFIESIRNKTTWKEQFRQKHGDGDYIWSELLGSPVYDDENQFTHMVVVSRNITLRKDYEQQLQHMAYHDPLTGLPNRRYFVKQLTEHIERIKDTDQRLALIMMDLDKFKLINDKMGHSIGDQVIQEFGLRISKVIRDEDLLARLGGDEFTLLVPNITSTNDVLEIANRIINIMNEPWCVEKYDFGITTSLGIVVSSSKAPENASEMLKYADKELYEAKKAGRNDYRLYDFMQNSLVN